MLWSLTAIILFDPLASLLSRKTSTKEYCQLHWQVLWFNVKIFSDCDWINWSRDVNVHPRRTLSGNRVCQTNKPNKWITSHRSHLLVQCSTEWAIKPAGRCSFGCNQCCIHNCHVSKSFISSQSNMYLMYLLSTTSSFIFHLLSSDYLNFHLETEDLK